MEAVFFSLRCLCLEIYLLVCWSFLILFSASQILLALFAILKYLIQIHNSIVMSTKSRTSTLINYPIDPCVNPLSKSWTLKPKAVSVIFTPKLFYFVIAAGVTLE